MKLIVNADDFGYSRAVNYGIVDSFHFGIVTSTTMMMNMPGTEHAIQLAKQNPDLGVGIHLVLTCRKPISGNVPSLVTSSGYFKTKEEIMAFQDISEEEVQREWIAQIEKFLSNNLKPSHLDSHHFVHSHPKLTAIIFHLAKKYHIPVRNDFGIRKDADITTTDVFYKNFFDQVATAESFYSLNSYVDKTIEVMCHPGYLDEELLKHSSYHHQRAKEVEVLTSNEVKQWVTSINAQLINFRDL